MGIISRFGDIMEANINAAFNKDENPDRMISDYIRELDSDMAKVKSEIGSVMAEEMRLKNKKLELEKEAAKMEEYVERAIRLEHEEDAKVLMNEKARIEMELASVTEAAELAEQNTAKLRQMYDKLQSDYDYVNTSKDALRGKISTAQSIRKVSDLQGGSPDSAMYKINAMEANADRILDAADARYKTLQQEAEIRALKQKYSVSSPENIDDELKDLKDKISKED